MSKEEDNKALVGRWFTEFWGETCKLSVVDELAHQGRSSGGRNSRSVG